MRAIYIVCCLILSAALSQEMMPASDGSSEPSADIHIRLKRMDPATSAPPGSLPPHQLPPFLANNLRAINIEAPTVVTITRNENIIGSGYAIHPYLILTRSVYVRPQHEFDFLTRNRFEEGHIPHRIQRIVLDPTGEFVIIQLSKPISMDESVHGAFQAANYPASVTNWAHDQAVQWIPVLLSHLRPILRQSLIEINFWNPAKVQVYSSERPFLGTGYAVHPYIVITRPEFVTRNSSVISSISTTGDAWDHRIGSRSTNRALNVDVLELLDPILLTIGETYSLTAENYSAHAIAWARTRVEEWKRTKLNQRNYYRENAA